MNLTLVPVREKAANNAKFGRYDAVLPDGRVLVRSRQPLLDGARALLAEGVSPETAITARHAGSEIVAMRSTLGEAAQWTIEESDRGGLRKRVWKANSSWDGASKTAGDVEAGELASGAPAALERTAA